MRSHAFLLPSFRNVLVPCGMVAGLALSCAAFAACGGASPVTKTDDKSDSGILSDAGAFADAGILSDAGAFADAGILSDAGTFASVVSVPLDAAPILMAFNPTNHHLYAGLITLSEGGASAGAGIAVLDATSNTVVKTIAEPDAGGPTARISAFAVDPVTNVVYATDEVGIYVIDGATDTITKRIPTLLAVGLAVDPTTHDLYVVGSATQGSTLTTYDGAGAQIGATRAMPDVAAMGPSSIAFEPSNHHLYLCGQASITAPGTAVADTIDVTTGLVAAPQQVFSGDFVGCAAGFGGGAIVTAPKTGQASVTFFDAITAPIPSGFNPLFVTANLRGAHGSVSLLGIGIGNGNLDVQLMTVAADGTVSAPTSLAKTASGNVWLSFAVGSPIASNEEQMFFACAGDLIANGNRIEASLVAHP